MNAERLPGRKPPEFVPFSLVSQFEPRGDQPQAIAALNRNLEAGRKYQTLLGITGSGKTFSVANVIAKQNRPTLVIAPNKTLAAQLYGEFKEFFPGNRVRYFVSYYDYYQPEAYVPSTDTYIEKDAAINDEIDKLRHSSTRAILEGTDTIVIASVSCIYGLGAPEDYFNMMLFAEKGDVIAREELLRKLVQMQYRRSDLDFTRGYFRVRGDTVDIFPSDEDAKAIRLVFFGDQVEEIREIDSISGATLRRLERCTIYPVSHFVTERSRVVKAIATIRAELDAWYPKLLAKGKLLEAERLKQRTLYDLELLYEVGFCPGIENYSRHVAGRKEGDPPTTLIDYFPKDFLLVIDESHVTVPQLGGMYRGDRSRKQTLVEYGFRLPSALDNRPLNQDEFWARATQTIFVSATPGDYELELSQGALIEQVNRPTGLLDPEVLVRPALNQVDDLLEEVRKTIERGDRVLVTTLTKKMSEDLSDYMRELGIKCRYLHSDINAIERVEILRGLRRGDFDVLIGINLLREGLDLVEVSLVAILDADKEGFLRSARSLIQTIGRAARNINGRAILYADVMTDSIRAAVTETERRRRIQAAFNAKHGIIPTSARSSIQPSLAPAPEFSEIDLAGLSVEVPKDADGQRKLLETLKREMFDAAAKREFERAANLRDTINRIQTELLKA
ncbi:MAG: excinuclease ABC subunit UvrB [Oligoflexia bacterium]|nr:excinuclease ABC subunit UvrB [Oligoflexia bacterium]